MVAIDHVGLAAHDPRGSAQALSTILGLGEPTTDGADDDMYRVELEGSFLLFSETTPVTAEHIAFRMSAAEFASVVARLREHGIDFGNDPVDPRNGGTTDPLGGAGRVYWLDQNGHLFEATC